MSSSSINASFTYKLAHILVNWFFNTFYDFSVSGERHIPLTGSVIFAANHASFYDPPLMGISAPRQLSFFARDTLFRGLLGKVIRGLGTIPVNRNAADIKSLKAIFKVLKNKGAIVIFPEGTRSSDGKLSKPKPGAGMIACKSKATVVPARIFGTFEVFDRRQKLPSLSGAIHVSFGLPMTVSDLDPGEDHPKRYEEASNRIMKEIAKLEAPKPTII